MNMAKDLNSSTESESGSSATMEDILVASRKTTQGHTGTETYSQRTLEKIQKPSYHIRRIKNKGAILILVWNFLLVNLFYCLYIYSDNSKINFVAWSLTLPLAGWIADVYFGRYKVIYFSLWVMWVGLILATVSSVVATFVESYSSLDDKIMLGVWALITIGFGGFMTNIIQFAIDQLHDASTNEIKCFITWFIWTFFSAGILVDYAYVCIAEPYRLFGLLFVCTCVTIVLCSIFFLNGTLVKEPLNQNPLKQIYGVIKYAIKTKHPRCRSAFTYGEDELPSRMDIAKTKYRGPFTTEQVEDVKTFLRLQTIVHFGCTMASGLLVVNYLRDQLIKVLSPMEQSTKECYFNSFYTKLFFYSVGVLIPVHELIVGPLLQRYFTWIRSYSKFSIGVILQIIRVIILNIYVILARHNYFKAGHSNATTNATTIQCLFQLEEGTLASSFDYRWMVLPSFINSISIAMFGIGGVEFLCAQTPYSMRGLMAGASFGSIAVFTLVGFGVTYPFTKSLSIWNTGMISCGFWYTLLTILYLLIDCSVMLIFRKIYKNRKREDVLPNEQIFAERYYGTQ